MADWSLLLGYRFLSNMRPRHASPSTPPRSQSPSRSIFKTRSKRHTDSILPRYYGTASKNRKLFSTPEQFSCRAADFPAVFSCAAAQRRKGQFRRADPNGSSTRSQPLQAFNCRKSAPPARPVNPQCGNARNRPLHDPFTTPSGLQLPEVRPARPPCQPAMWQC